MDQPVRMMAAIMGDQAEPMHPASTPPDAPHTPSPSTVRVTAAMRGEYAAIHATVGANGIGDPTDLARLLLAMAAEPDKAKRKHGMAAIRLLVSAGTPLVTVDVVGFGSAWSLRRSHSPNEIIALAAWIWSQEAGIESDEPPPVVREDFVRSWAAKLALMRREQPWAVKLAAALDATRNA